jgi:hypothetical protein
VKVTKRLIGALGAPFMMCLVVVCWVATGDGSWAERQLDKFLRWSDC